MTKNKSGFRGVYFNPVLPAGSAGLFDSYETVNRIYIRTVLKELADEACINLITFFVPIGNTLKTPPFAPVENEPILDWGNFDYLDNVSLFINDCHDFGISVEIDLADNRWVPYRIDSANQIGQPGGSFWPVAGDTPWVGSGWWFGEVIRYIESKTKNAESIAMWCMMGHYQLGTAEPDLWGNVSDPDILKFTEKFVKEVWPVFYSAGQRPKAAPILLPIFAKDPAWNWLIKTPEDRLCAFNNLKKWIVDDLDIPPDYWVMTTYPYCDPAPDGFYYIKRIVEILGEENASKIISTDLKWGEGHDFEIEVSTIDTGGHSGKDMLDWHFAKCREYGFGGWWIWSYLDSPDHKTGIRDREGHWRTELLEVIRKHSSDE